MVLPATRGRSALLLPRMLTRSAAVALSSTTSLPPRVQVSVSGKQMRSPWKTSCTSTSGNSRFRACRASWPTSSLSAGIVSSAMYLCRDPVSWCRMGVWVRGSRRSARKNSNTPPARARGKPTRASSNMDRAGCPPATARSLTMMLVEVPMRVVVPARMEAKLRGMR